MGGGASHPQASAQMEEMLAYTMLLGNAISEMSFPGIHSLKEFDMAPPSSSRCSSSAERTKSGEEECEDLDDENSLNPPPLIDPELEKKYFMVLLQDRAVYLDKVGEDVTNDDGWTALHACCHSNSTSKAGLAILKEVKRKGGNLNLKTKRGPGAFNSGWTPLHMAAAYGVLPMVEGLLEAGAKVDCKNDVAWTPLLEACHRGFTAIVKALVSAGANIGHIPSEEDSKGSQFMRGPPQSALGEASRCGHAEICKFLLDRGADKDLTNHLGWTALHEACFYNNAEVVQLLLVHGADALKKNTQGAMPYNLASLPSIRTAIEEIAGERAAKDMPVPTFILGMDENGQMFIGVKPTESDPEEAAKPKSKALENSKHGSSSPKGARGKSQSPTRTGQAGDAKAQSGDRQGEQEEAKPAALHRGSLLGELPALGRARPGGGEEKAEGKDRARGGFGGGSTLSSQVKVPVVPAGTPAAFVCQLSKRVMKDPVLTPYGNTYDRDMIRMWLHKQGSIDPLTGNPLVESQLIEAKDLKRQMRDFDLEKVASKNNATGGGSQGVGAEAKGGGDRREEDGGGSIEGSGSSDGGRRGKASRASEDSTAGRSEGSTSGGGGGRGGGGGGGDEDIYEF